MDKKPLFLHGRGYGRGRVVNSSDGKRMNMYQRNLSGSEGYGRESKGIADQLDTKKSNYASAENNTNNSQKSNQRFLEASQKMQETVKKHLKLNSFDDDASEEELDDDVVSVIFKSYSNNYESGDNQMITSAQEDLLHSFRSSTSACLVCIESIKKSEAIWSCHGCFAMFHMQCIQKWVREGAYQQLSKMDDDAATPWYCPKCRYEYQQSECPVRYACFCGKVEDPKFDPWLVPHSCGQTCNKKLKPECGHLCLLLCHPGPCPPCPQIVLATCHCEKSVQTTRCSSKAWSCGKPCGRKLSCKQHHCQQQCHAGKCPSCPRTSKHRCLCGNEATIQPCAHPQWQCEKPCRKMLKCGHHTCERICHDGECGVCPRAGVQFCPCGKTKFELPCTEDIPTCSDTCGKDLACGVHSCLRRCHRGACDTCHQVMIKKCRCGQRQKEVPCCKEYTCEIRCAKLRDCGRHQCKRRCCDKNCSKCEQVCGRNLSCKKHKCSSKCHTGPCYPCMLTVNIFCFCKHTFITVPCGRERATKPPKCQQICRIPPDCHHPKRAAHRCHFGYCPPCKYMCNKLLAGCQHTCPLVCHGAVRLETKTSHPLMTYSQYKVDDNQNKLINQPCPPCEVPLPVSCFGKHEVTNIPCAKAKPYSCKQLCGGILSCGNHTCTLECHEVTETADDSQSTCVQCESKCVKQRPNGCVHICLLPCHPEDCPPCKLMFRTNCHCQIMIKHISCHEWTSSDITNQDKLKSCGQPCPKLLECGHKCGLVCHASSCGKPGGCEKRVTLRCACKRKKKDFICKEMETGRNSIECDEQCLHHQQVQLQVKEEKEKAKQEEKLKQQKAEFEDFQRKQNRGHRKKFRRQQPRDKQPKRFMTTKVISFISVAVIVLAAALYYITL